MSGIPYPDNLTPDGGNLVALAINEYWFSVLFGFAKDALQRYLWDVTDEQWEEEVKPAILTMLALDTVMCDSLICDIKFEDGVLSVKRAGDWEPVENTESIVTAISPIAGGFEVQQGGEFIPLTSDCADPCNSYSDMPAYEGSGNARSCNIATNLVEWIMEKYQDSLDLADAAVNTITAADAILAAVPPVYFAWDALTDAVDEFYEATISISRALDTVGLREDMKEFLYCQLVENDHIMSEAIWDAFKDEFALIGDSIWLYLGAFQWGAIDNEAHKASYGEASGCETFECGEEWCIEWDFSIFNGSFDDYADEGRGHWNGVDAWVQDTVSGTTRVDIISPLFTACLVTRIEVDQDTDYSGVSPNRYVDVRDGSSTVIDSDDTGEVADGEGTDSFTVGGTGVRQIRLAYQTGTGGAGGTCSIFKIRMYGTGEPPPELTPCP